MSVMNSRRRIASPEAQGQASYRLKLVTERGAAMSALGQKRTYAVQKVMSALPPKADMCSALAHVCFVPIADIAPSFDQFVGPRKKRIWDSKTQSLGGREIDYQFKLSRLLDRKISWVCPFEYLIDVVGCASGHRNGVWSVRKKPAFFCPISPSSCQWNSICRRKLNNSFYVQREFDATRRHRWNLRPHYWPREMPNSKSSVLRTSTK